jgi:hypothetical protein
MTLITESQPATPYQPVQPMPKKSGCGCCLWGCFGFLVLSVIFLVGSYFGIRYASDWVLSDRSVTWIYQNYARDQIRTMLPPQWSDAEKNRVMAQADASLQEFLTLPPEQKALLKKEAMTALYYYSQSQVIPPEKIPNLTNFLNRQMENFQGRPANSPRLLQ